METNAHGVWSRKETEEITGQHPRRIPEDDDGKQFAARGFTKPGTIRGNFGADATSQVPSSGQEGVVVHRGGFDPGYSELNAALRQSVLIITHKNCVVCFAYKYFFFGNS